MANPNYDLLGRMPVEQRERRLSGSFFDGFKKPLFYLLAGLGVTGSLCGLGMHLSNMDNAAFEAMGSMPVQDANDCLTRKLAERAAGLNKVGDGDLHKVCVTDIPADSFQP